MSFTNQTKHATILTNASKSGATVFADQNKHSTAFTNASKGSQATTWDQATFTWDGAGARTWNDPTVDFANTTKHTTSFTNQTKHP